MEENKTHETQQATPDIPSPNQPPAFTTKMHPLPSHKSKWLLVLIIVFLVIFVSIYTTKFLTEKNLQKQTTIVTPSPSAPTPDPTANWKTFIHTKFGYSIKYPPEMEVRSLSGLLDPTQDSIILIQNIQNIYASESSMVIKSKTNEHSQKLKDFSEDFFRFIPPKDIKDITIKNTTIDKRPAVYAEINGDHPKGEYNAYAVIIEQDEMHYKIITSPYIFVSEGNYKKDIFDKILSTFKFTK